MVINCINITDISNENYQQFSKAVSEERRKKADRYRFFDDSKRCICAELLLRFSLYQSIGRFVELDIISNKFGKPFMHHRSDFLYNLSHSGNWVVIAYGSSEVGIDIEKVQIGKEDIAARFFSEEEKKFVFTAAGEDKDKRFTQIWTLKESYVKYLGTGLSTELDSFSVTTGGIFELEDHHRVQKDINLKSYSFDEDYILAVCSTEEAHIIREIAVEDMIQFMNKAENKGSNI